jgi:Ca2+-binding EF-hand superfamily protein
MEELQIQQRIFEESSNALMETNDALKKQVVSFHDFFKVIKLSHLMTH